MEKQIIDNFKLKDFAPGEGLSHGAFTEKLDTKNWIDVAVPGDVHRALIAAGRIPDPFYDRNEQECAWVDEREWWYRSRFEYKQYSLRQDERLMLIFHGLDTFVTIWLNEEQLGMHSNMFREVVFDITRDIRINGLNTLALCFKPPLYYIRDKQSPSWTNGIIGENKRNLMRKAQFVYGWDWGPRLPTIGIWRDIELHRQHIAAIKGVHSATVEIDPAYNNALVSVKVEIERFAGKQPLELVITLILPDKTDAVAVKTISLCGSGSNLKAETLIKVDKPYLWWTHDLGEPYLYMLQIKLLNEGNEIDKIEQKLGIRTLKLDQSPDKEEKGTHFFRFVLNNVQIFARGANWIPADSFVGSLTGERYEILLKAAKNANMNMLRVWGGGIYEHDVFYDLCDSLGILVWQDFMFACAPYPEDNQKFVDDVRMELCYQVRRLRSHPCIALWCGNNENQMCHYRIDRMQEQKSKLLGTLYYDKIMPEVVRDLDGITAYWPGSPYGGRQPNSMTEGDVHDWHVWHGHPVDKGTDSDCAEVIISEPKPEDVSFIHYAEDMGRFISEFGMHASPVYETLHRSIPQNQLYLHSPSMDHHNKDNPKNKGDNLMLSVTGLPKNLTEYIDFSMIAQAEGLKFGIEHFRRRKPHCSGTLIWQLNDCWPGLSWSIIDYFGFGKAGYFYVKRAYAQVIASFKAWDDGGTELWITNDSVKEVRDTVKIQYGTFSDGTEWEEKLEVHIPANTSRVVWRSNPEKIFASPDKYLAVRSNEKKFPANRHFFTAVKDLKLPVAEPDIKITASGEHEVLVKIHTRVYLFYVYMIVQDESTQYNDNYFDMIPGERCTVVVKNRRIRLIPDMVSVGWR